MIPITILFIGTFVIAFTNADIIVSGFFYENGTWHTGHTQPWHLLYQLDRFPALALGVGGLCAAVAALLNQKRQSWLKPGLFLVLLLVLGPGITVNSIFKEYWGRPRPREVVQFGGQKEFLQPWQKGIAHNGRSFPSGHSSAAFYLTAPYFILRTSKRNAARYWLAGGLIFGVLMSVARITQGGHFLSDTLWAWGIVHLIAAALYYLLQLHHVSQPSSAEIP